MDIEVILIKVPTLKNISSSENLMYRLIQYSAAQRLAKHLVEAFRRSKVV